MQVVIKNAYAAVNPLDWKIQDSGAYIQSYPNILGEDVAGEVVEVGPDVKTIKKGMRVLAHPLGFETGQPKNGGFQQYTVVSEIVVAQIPDSLSFEQASVLPLAISTASAGLYQKDHLALPYPTTSTKPSGKTILIWGAASSVGATAVQLSKASGLEVVATASAKNFDLVKSLGADHLFDYNSSSVVDDIVSALKGKSLVGVYDSISQPETVKSGAAILKALGGGKIVTVLPPPEGLPEGVTAVGAIAITIATVEKEVGQAVWGKYVPAALANGSLQAKPDPMTFKGGLSKVQEAMDRQKAGVSARKIVVEI